MRLHDNKSDFKVLISNIHRRTGYRSDVIEKDYYVFLFLQEIASLQKKGIKVYFKGGTALYKALKTTNRFSEDIDLSIDVRELASRTQKDKMLESATKKYISLPRDKNQGFTNRSEIEAIYIYNPITIYDANDELQRFGKLKVEGTSFTISEPIESMEVSALLYEFATIEEKRILKEKYGLNPIYIKTITLERIFIDKLFAAEAYVRRANDVHKAFEAAKHIYDLAVLKNHRKIKILYQDEKMMEYLLKIRLEEELDRHDGIPGVLPKDFHFYNDIITNKNIQVAYEKMQHQYVFKDEDRIPFTEIGSSMKSIRNLLFKNKTWLKIEIPQKEKSIEKSNTENDGIEL